MVQTVKLNLLRWIQLYSRWEIKKTIHGPKDRNSKIFRFRRKMEKSYRFYCFIVQVSNTQAIKTLNIYRNSYMKLIEFFFLVSWSLKFEEWQFLLYIFLLSYLQLVDYIWFYCFKYSVLYYLRVVCHFNWCYKIIICIQTYKHISDISCQLHITRHATLLV